MTGFAVGFLPSRDGVFFNLKFDLIQDQIITAVKKFAKRIDLLREQKNLHVPVWDQVVGKKVALFEF